jgi:peptidoglycan DL-endopeptidase CwlO
MRSPTVASTIALLALVGLTSACVSPRGSRPAPPPRDRRSTGTGSVAVDGLPRRVAIARSLVGKAYRYGGETPAGFDCSGFVRYVFARDGLGIPRSATEQAQAGRWVPLDELGAGDLVFFSEVGSKPHHVGIVVSPVGEPLRMIHASTSQGVVETEVFTSSYWLRRLRFGRRIEAAAGGRG